VRPSSAIRHTLSRACRIYASRRAFRSSSSITV
jgi:hypothetical protein